MNPIRKLDKIIDTWGNFDLGDETFDTHNLQSMKNELWNIKYNSIVPVFSCVFCDYNWLMTPGYMAATANWWSQGDPRKYYTALRSTLEWEVTGQWVQQKLSHSHVWCNRVIPTLAIVAVIIFKHILHVLLCLGTLYIVCVQVCMQGRTARYHKKQEN